MSDSRIRALDAPAQLHDDHERMRDLFVGYQALGEGPRPSKRELFELIRRELALHALIEEDVYYPAIEHAPDPSAARLVTEARQEHRILKRLLSEIGALGLEDEGFDPKMLILREGVERHAHAEDRGMSDLFRRLPEDIRDDVSDRLRSRRREMNSVIDPGPGDAGPNSP